MQIPKEQEYLLKHIEANFYETIKMISQKGIGGLDEDLIDKIVNKVKEDNLLREIYSNTYSLYYTPEELTSLSEDMESLVKLEDKVLVLTSRYEQEILNKTNTIFDNWIEHNSDLWA